MRYLSIDDEAIAHSVIAMHCRTIEGMECVANCAGADEALEVLLEQTVDLIFLDIEMPGLSGLQLLRRLPDAPLIIIVSAHREYALDSYEFEVCDYLLKPFSQQRFHRAVETARARLGERKAGPAVPDESALFVRDEKGRRRIRFEDIVHIEACRNYSCIHTVDGQMIVTEKISALATRLPQGAFVRTHRSHIVPVARIKRIDAGSVNLGAIDIPVGRTYKSRVRALAEAFGRDRRE